MNETSGPLLVPRAIARGGRRAWLTSAGAGAALAVPGLVLASLLSRDAAFGFLAILLGMIAAVYLGFALNDGRARIVRVEYAGIAGFAALATVALAEKSAVLLAAGYFAHALWDAIHHRRGVDTTMPSWYVPLCISADVVIGGYVLVRFA